MLRHPDHLTLVEHLFLLAHDDARSMRPQIDVRAIGVGLAAAALTDLLIARRIHIVNGSAYPIDRRSRPIVDNGYRGVRTGHRHDRESTDDPITDQVLTVIANLRHAPGLHLLLRDLGPDLYTPTRQALVTKRVISAERRWGRTRHELAQISSTAWIRQEVRDRIHGRQKDDVHTDALCALVWALNVQHCLLMDLTRTQIDELLRGVMYRIPELISWSDPDAPAVAIPEIADAVRTAVAGLATSPY